MAEQRIQSDTMNIYEFVTECICMHLDYGDIPWRRSWHEPGIPRNLITDAPYRGINLWLLHSLGFEQNRFLTKQQMNSIGAAVKEGEFGLSVMKQPEKIFFDDTVDPLALELYKLFNVSQCDGIPDSLLSPMIEKKKHPLQVCDAILGSMPKLAREGDTGRPLLKLEVHNCINLPDEAAFNTAEDMFASFFHLMMHGSGSNDRLNRTYEKECEERGFSARIMEEVVADLGTGYLCSIAGIPIPHQPDASEYGRELSRYFKFLPRFIVQAGRYAQQAVEHILNVQRSPNAISQEDADQAT